MTDINEIVGEQIKELSEVRANALSARFHKTAAHYEVGINALLAIQDVLAILKESDESPETIRIFQAITNRLGGTNKHSDEDVLIASVPTSDPELNAWVEIPVPAAIVRGEG